MQEMHDTYSSYGCGKLLLASLKKDSAWGSKGGWLDLSDGSSRILYNAKVVPRELPRMPQLGCFDEQEQPAQPEVVDGSKDRDGDTDMAAEEFKCNATEN